MSLTQSELDWFAARLSIAVYDTNQEIRMGLFDKPKPVNDKPGYTPMRPAPAWLDKLNESQPSPVETKPEAPMTSITGYQPGAIQARLSALKAKRQAGHDAAMAKLDQAETVGEQVNSQLDKLAEQELKAANDALHEFAQFTNGAPE